MKIIATTVLLIVMLAGAGSLQAQTASTVKGYVTDRTTGELLRGVTIRIAGTQLGAIADKDGRFLINGVPIGKVLLQATLLGYESESVSITLFNDGTSTKEVVFTMMPTSLQTSEIVVSAGRRIQAVQDVPISVATLSQEDLMQRGITQIDQALRYVSGVSVVGDQVNIRGASGFAFGLGSRTMILLDGFPLISGDNGDIKFDVMPVGDVERVEIVKGAGSALYGTGALGGVVSMFTSSPTEELSISGRLYGGLYTDLRHATWQSYRTHTPTQWGGDVRASQKIGDWSINLSGGVRSDESYRNFDQQLRGFGYGKLRWEPTDAHRITLSTLYAQQQSENFIYWQDLTNATEPPTTQDRNEELWTAKWATAVEWQYLVDSKTSIVVRPGFYRTRFENRIDGVTQDSNASTAYAYNMDAMLTTQVIDKLTLSAGLTGKANVVSADVYGEQLQTIFSGFVQAEVALPHSVLLTAGLRVDREETATLEPQLELSPKLGASWKATEEINVRASVGRGFRAATISERYANIRYGPFQVKPNPDIQPEYSWSAEIGARYAPKGLGLPLELDWALFDNELYDLIEPNFDLTDPTVPITFRNISRARILGTELTVRVALSQGIGLETGLTAMLPQDLLLDEPLKYRNNILWYTRGRWAFPAVGVDWELQAEYRFQNRVERIDDRLNLFIPDADQRVPSHVVDARLFADIERATGYPLRIGVLARNLLDYYYAEVVANVSPTRSLLLQIEWR